MYDEDEDPKHKKRSAPCEAPLWELSRDKPEVLSRDVVD